MTHTQETTKPTIGGTFVDSKLGLVEIVAVHPLHTVDVRKVGTDQHYRVTGVRLVPSQDQR